MHLKRIELTNFRQHKKLDVDFEGNLIAVLGSNGSGKSNLIGGIQFALTGEQPGFTKADLTTWGEKEGSVRLYFTAGSKNEEFCITRKTNGDVTLKVGDETIKQARKVEDVLRDRAGLDKDLIKQIVFVRQAGIDAILFDDPKNREVAFQRLIGIGNASKIYEAMRTEIAAYDKPQGFDEAIARARSQLAEQEGIVTTCRTAIGRYESAINSLPTKEVLEGEVDRLVSAKGAVDEYTSVCQRLADVQALHEMSLKKLNDIGAASEVDEEQYQNELDRLTSEAESLRQKIEQGKESIRFLTRMKELSDAAIIAKAELGTAEGALQHMLDSYQTTLEDDKARVKEIEAAEVAAESEDRSLSNLAKEASSDGTCPVCGAPATQEDIHKHLDEKLSAAKKAYAEAVEKGKQARMAYDKREAEEIYARRGVDRKRSAYDIAFAALKKAHDANVEGCDINLETFKVSYKGETPDALPQLTKENSALEAGKRDVETRMVTVRGTLSGIKSDKARYKDARDSVARYATQVDTLIQSKQTCAKRLADIGIDPESAKDGAAAMPSAIAKARSNLDAYNGILRDMAAEKGSLASAEKTIESTKKFIEELVQKKELEDKVKEKVDTLKRVRDWFHYREGPRIMSQNVMRDLTACVNNYLDQFNAPFVVEAEEEGFGFRCCFIDGRYMPDPHPDASQLSGGQKVALAIAFRLAIYMCFGGELGLLSLDEPTAYLDDATVTHLGEMLQKVGEIARNKGLQILMATHEKGIMPYLDSKIDLSVLKKED